MVKLIAKTGPQCLSSPTKSKKGGRSKGESSKISRNYLTLTNIALDEKHFIDDRSKSFVRQVMKSALLSRTLDNQLLFQVRQLKKKGLKSGAFATQIRKMVSEHVKDFREIVENFHKRRDWENVFLLWLNVKFIGEPAEASEKNQKLMDLILGYLETPIKKNKKDLVMPFEENNIVDLCKSVFEMACEELEPLEEMSTWEIDTQASEMEYERINGFASEETGLDMLCGKLSMRTLL